MIAQSYSKNFGLYGERIGALSVTTNDGPEVAAAIQSQLKLIVRPMYSNPPTHGARIVRSFAKATPLQRRLHKAVFEY